MREQNGHSKPHTPCLRKVKIDQLTGSDSNFSYRQMPPFLRFVTLRSLPAFCLGVVSAGIGGFRVQSADLARPKRFELLAF